MHYRYVFNVICFVYHVYYTLCTFLIFAANKIAI